MSEFASWADRWMELARYGGAEFPSDEHRIERVLELWREPVPPGWERAVADDARLLTRERFTRKPSGEHGQEVVIESALLAKDVPPSHLFGEPIVDGVNAVPLVKGARHLGNVEADMLLLVGSGAAARLVVVEVKVAANHAWYAVVENLRQLKLVLESPVRGLFHRRQPDLALPEETELPVAALVLAPRAFYTAKGQKANAVEPARELCNAMKTEGVQSQLAAWDAALEVV